MSQFIFALFSTKFFKNFSKITYSTNIDIKASNKISDLLDILFEFCGVKPKQKIYFKRSSKYKHKHTWFKFIYVLLIIDFIYTIIFTIICCVCFDTKEEKIQFYLITGDLVYLIFENRIPMSARSLNILFRMQALLFFTNFFFDDHHWLKKADQQLKELKFAKINAKTYKILFTCKKRSFLQFFLLSAGTVIILTILAIKRSDKYSPYSLVFGIIYAVYFISLNIYYITIFTNEYYFLCKICEHFILQFNQKLTKVVHSKNLTSSDLIYEKLLFSYKEFSHIFILIHNVNFCLKRIYLIVLFAGFCTATQFFYMAFYTDVRLFIKLYFFVLTFNYFHMIVFCSYYAGKINDAAKSLSNVVYQKISVEGLCNFEAGKQVIIEVCNSMSFPMNKKSFYFQTFRYLNCVNSNISIELLGNAVNIQTTITVNFCSSF